MSAKVEPILRNAKLITEGEKVVPQKVDFTAYGKAADKKPILASITVAGADGKTREIPRDQWPKELSLSNTEGVAFSLITAHPGSIEIAGVILLMAMLGAVVLARKKVEIDDAALALALQRERSGDELGIEGRFTQPGVGEGGVA